VYAEVSDLVSLADLLGVDYFWFSEHHAHAHYGHLPTPLLLALHLAGKTNRIRLGTAIICLNLHHPLDVAEQVAVADVLSGARMVAGFGSGSTPEEFELFGLKETADAERHARFETALGVILGHWRGEGNEAGRMLPAAASDLPGRSWLAVNSAGSARIAGRLGFGMLFSHLRTPAQYREYRDAYAQAGGRGLVAANRPVYVGEDDEKAWAEAGTAVRMLWRRFRTEGKIPKETPEPQSPREMCGHPLNFIVGGAETVARELLALHKEAPFDVANLEVRWDGLSHALVRGSLQRLAERVGPQLRHHTG
jgi:alkanesulfonate monooxygenase SsuD/methylene tetrahydromethanopterin reductase-like flavin-dependent oxidoreductase (luciferase family)